MNQLMGAPPVDAERDALKLLEPGKHHFEWAGDMNSMIRHYLRPEPFIWGGQLVSLTNVDKDAKTLKDSINEYKKARKRSRHKPKPKPIKKAKPRKKKTD